MDKRLNRRRAANRSHQPWETTGYERAMGKEGEHPLIEKYQIDLANALVHDADGLCVSLGEEKSL